eukprot:TRINITY_DN9804_c0_g1_i1.p1 TRINITY_DN9804_c0_g1~~TRINITY_DN9804_c0_g1_i1.p1  ORF type:complete len:198 (+),score=38.94 TRINITY_DN9804_c0_g1_i1:46-639(+)
MDPHKKDADLLCKVLVEFVEKLIQSVLRVRGVYPDAMFEECIYLGAECWVARHGLLSAYVEEQVGNVMPLVRKGTVDRIVVVVMKDGVAVECVGLDIAVHVLTAPLDRSILSDCLASFLHKLKYLNTVVPPHDPDLTWTFEAHSPVESPSLTSPHWVPTSRDAKPGAGAALYPIRSTAAHATIASLPLSLQLFIESY